MTQEAQLKACPFCGGEAEIDEIAGGIGALFFASCKDDDCCGYRIDPWVKHSRRIEAAQHWNTRTPDSVIAEVVEAAQELKADLLERAEWDGDVRVVCAGAGAWARFCNALAKWR
jgi:hypothetical protein